MVKAYQNWPAKEVVGLGLSGVEEACYGAQLACSKVATIDMRRDE